MKKNKNNGRVIFGAVLVLLGLVFFGDNLHFFSYEMSDYIFSWETILILIGVIMLANSTKNFTGYLFILIGGGSLVADYYNYSFWEIFDNYWPILLILLGLYIIYRRGDSSKHKCKEKDEFGNFDDSNCCEKTRIVEDDEEEIDITAIFSGQKVILKSKNFKGGKTTAIFGGVMLDFREAKLQPGPNIIDTFTMFGGTEILVPKEWKLSVNISVLFGGIDDKRDIVFAGPEDQESTLILKGLTLFGGTEIKYV